MAAQMKPTRQITSARKRFWFDPRLAVGLLLIIVSVLGVVGIVAAADASVQVLATRDSLSPGDHIDSADLVAVSVRLDTTRDLYLAPDEIPDEGVVVTKAVAAGELLPASAVGAVAGIELASVVVSVAGELPAAVDAGATVDLWASRQQESSVFGPPSVIVPSALVVRVVESDGLVASGEQTSIELLVPRLRVARVLEAIANEDSLSVVPASIPVKG